MPMLQRFQWPSPRSVSARYALLMGALTAGLLLVSGLIEMTLSFVDARRQIGTLQTLQARAAAAEIEQSLGAVHTVLRSVSRLPWGQPGFDIEQRRIELQRLLVLLPAVTDLRVIDGLQREILFLSRVEPDRLGPQGDADASTPWLPTLAGGEFKVGPTFFGDGAQPFVYLAQADASPQTSLTIAAMDLRFLADVIGRLRVGEKGQIYLVDERNRLIAHPRATHVLRRLDLSRHETIRLARQALSQSNTMNAVDSVDLDGVAVTSTAVPLGVPGWLLFVEQPRSEVLRPVFASLQRTAALVALGLILAAAASFLFARNMAAPIVRLRQATRRMAEGDLASRVPAHRRDELGQLAHDFNKMAAQLEASYAGLEARIYERTQQLAQARDAAERASAAKTRFLATASHDLRQPMHTIGLLVTVLCTELRDRRAQKVAEKLQLCVRLMEALFASLLDISKLDAGGVRVMAQTFGIDELLQRIVQALEPQAQRKALSLRLRLSNAMVHTDPALLERVLSNLVSNAIQYTQQGKVLVGCRRRGELLALQVWDSGPGIAEDQVSAIFEEFYRIDAASAHGSGLGLGLSIVKRSLELMGHQLQLRSWPGRGSMFEVLLPYRRVSPDAGAGQARATAEAGSSSLAGSFVLLIDDHDDNRSALEALFQGWACHVLSATSLAQALSALEQHLRSPDVLISDYRLGPGPDGLAAIEAVREHLGETLPAVLMTAELDGAVHARARALAVPVLHKPASPESLRQTVLALLQHVTASGSEA